MGYRSVTYRKQVEVGGGDAAPVAIGDAIALIKKNYVEDVDDESLLYGAIKGMLSSLDPHSSFMPPEIYKDMKVDTRGEFGGLGIEITITRLLGKWKVSQNQPPANQASLTKALAGTPMAELIRQQQQQ